MTHAPHSDRACFWPTDGRLLLFYSWDELPGHDEELATVAVDDDGPATAGLDALQMVGGAGVGPLDDLTQQRSPCSTGLVPANPD
jgi:hypothetical protein